MSYHLGRVIDHIHLKVSDLGASRKFYRAICQALAIQEAFKDGMDHFSIDEIYVDTATDYISRVHLAFQAQSRKGVDEFYRLAIEAGGRPNGAPGVRPYHDQYYAAFVFDPDGNNIEAVCDAPTKRSSASVTVERK